MPHVPIKIGINPTHFSKKPFVLDVYQTVTKPFIMLDGCLVI
jgi:hypothetical protein